MAINLKELSTADLDDLISKSIEERASRGEYDTSQPPHAKFASLTPGWTASVENGRMVISLRHTGAGIVAFAFDRNSLALLFGYLAQVVARAELTNEAITPAAITAPGSMRVN